MKKVLNDTIMVVLSNAWIALFSFYQFTNENNVHPIWWAILIGLLIVVVTGVTDEKFDREIIKKAVKTRELEEILKPNFKNHKSAWVCLLCELAFFVLLILPMYINNLPVIFLYSIAILLVFLSCRLYNNNLMNTLLKPLWLNFSCPILAYYFCAKLVLSFWDIFKDYIDENAFISFVQALFNVYVNTVYIAALIFIFYLASVCICWIKVAIEFVKARLKRAA